MSRFRPLAFIVLSLATTYLAAQDLPTLTAEEAARTLIAGEYDGRGGIQTLQPACTQEGGGDLSTEKNVDHEWGYGNFWCQGKPVLTLKKFLGLVEGKPRFRIADAVVIPAYYTGESWPPPATALSLTWTGLCTLDGKRDRFIMALVREDRPKRNGERQEVVHAWGFDTQREKIVPISTKRVRCVHDEP